MLTTLNGSLRRNVSSAGISASATPKAGDTGGTPPSPLDFHKGHPPPPPRILMGLAPVGGGGGGPGVQWSQRGVCFLAFALLFGLALISLPVLSYATSAAVRPPLEPGGGPTAYGIVIDAGSSGSRLHVFRYAPSTPLAHIFPSSLSLKIKPGLSHFANNPSAAGASLVELIAFAHKHVPEAERAATPLFLMATAGMRRLDPLQAEAILESCRGQLSTAGFLFRHDWASIISGTHEGVYAWVAANYALGNLGRPPSETTGVVELGGASAQVTFVPDVPPPPEFRYDLTLGATTYTLYTHSFLNYGQDAAMDEVFVESLAPPLAGGGDLRGVPRDPCRPRGYTITAEDVARHIGGSSQGIALGKLPPPGAIPEAGGNFSECRSAAVKLLERGRGSCAFKRCAIGGAFTPELRGDFFATENFYYTAQFFGLPAASTLAEIAAVGEKFCNMDWAAVRQMHRGVAEEDLLKFCFSTAYIVALMEDGLGISPLDTRLRFTNNVGSTPVDWALGALIAALASGVTGGADTPPFWWRAYEALVLALVAAGVMGLGVVLVRALVDYRRPSVGGVGYDLEKGSRFLVGPYRTA